MIKKSIKNIFSCLSNSEFRSGIKLLEKDRQIYLDKGEAVIRRHASDLIKKRLAPAKPKNDTRQTPFHGHPVFAAQHATATCCRKCLSKWHNIPKGRELINDEIDYIVELIMYWLAMKIKNF